MDDLDHDNFVEGMDSGQMEWCEECQGWFPVDEGEIHCDCERDFEMDCDKELNFN